MLKEQEAIIVSGVTALPLEGDSVVDMTAYAEQLSYLEVIEIYLLYWH